MSPTHRPRRMAGTNTKMAMTPAEVGNYLERLRDLVHGVTDVDVFVLPPFPALPAARLALEGSSIAWGAQDVFPIDHGAHTGEVSAPMLADLGCRFVMVGHFERRRDRGESNELVGQKAIAVQRWGMTPLIAIGEAVRDDFDRCAEEVARQIDALDGVDLASTVFAYEPGWSIGVGAAAAEPSWISAMHTRIRERLAGQIHNADAVRLITGGSLTIEAAPSTIELTDVDGLFVGRNALDPVRFAQLIHSISKERQ